MQKSSTQDMLRYALYVYIDLCCILVFHHRDWYETKSRDCFASTSYELVSEMRLLRKFKNIFQYKDEQKIKRENERKFVEFERQLLVCAFNVLL